MKSTVKLFGIIALGVGFTFTSCQKEGVNPLKPESSLDAEVSTDEANVRLSNSGYETASNQLENANGSEIYTNGTLEYKLNGQVVAVVDFGNGTSVEKAKLIKDGISTEFDLKKKKQDSDYKKIIVKPLVKTDDCDYIVEGIIKYYNFETGEYIATIDYGNGSCDEWATKTWAAYKGVPAGSKIFSLNDWKKKK
jgi:hypothetical protein